MPEEKCTASKESYLVSSCQINKSICRNIFRHEKIAYRKKMENSRETGREIPVKHCH
jgi:hypothetical protein